jgi:anti-sigma factor ChrR (cupin superfamily)
VTIDDETLIAYADGELDAARRVEVEAAVEADPALAERLARHRALRERIAGAYAGVADEPAPDALAAVIAAGGPKSAGEVIDLAARRAAREKPADAPARAWTWKQAAAMAACLALGVAVAWPLWRGGGGAPAPIRLDRDGMVAQGELARALSTRLASDETTAEAVKVGLSFKDRDGYYCRTFQTPGAAATAGLACRQGELWRVRVAAQARPEAASGPFRTAASPIPPAVQAAVDAAIAGDTLDAKGEADARARGWKPAR